MRSKSPVKIQEVSYNMPPAKITFQVDELTQLEYQDYYQKKEVLDRKVAKYVVDKL